MCERLIINDMLLDVINDMLINYDSLGRQSDKTAYWY